MQKTTSISLPPPSIPMAPPNMRGGTSWPNAPQQQNLPAKPMHKDIAVLGADIIAETFGDLIKKGVVPPGKVLTPDDKNRSLASPVVASPSFPPPPSSSSVPQIEQREFPNQHQAPGPFNQPGPPDKGEWNPRLGPPPPRRGRGGMRQNFGWPDGRPPPPDFHPSPFSWQRPDYRERHPSFDEDRPFQQEFPPPQNPYSYRKPDIEPPPPPKQQDPRLLAGDPRKARGKGGPPAPSDGGPGGFRQGPGHGFPGGPGPAPHEFHDRGPPPHNQMDQR